MPRSYFTIIATTLTFTLTIVLPVVTASGNARGIWATPDVEEAFELVNQVIDAEIGATDLDPNTADVFFECAELDANSHCIIYRFAAKTVTGNEIPDAHEIQKVLDAVYLYEAGVAEGKSGEMWALRQVMTWALSWSVTFQDLSDSAKHVRMAAFHTCISTPSRAVDWPGRAPRGAVYDMIEGADPFLATARSTRATADLVSPEAQSASFLATHYTYLYATWDGDRQGVADRAFEIANDALDAGDHELTGQRGNYDRGLLGVLRAELYDWTEDPAGAAWGTERFQRVTEFHDAAHYMALEALAHLNRPDVQDEASELRQRAVDVALRAGALTVKLAKQVPDYPMAIDVAKNAQYLRDNSLLLAYIPAFVEGGKYELLFSETQELLAVEQSLLDAERNTPGLAEDEKEEIDDALKSHRIGLDGCEIPSDLGELLYNYMRVAEDIKDATQAVTFYGDPQTKTELDKKKEADGKVKAEITAAGRGSFDEMYDTLHPADGEWDIAAWDVSEYIDTMEYIVETFEEDFPTSPEKEGLREKLDSTKQEQSTITEEVTTYWETRGAQSWDTPMVQFGHLSRNFASESTDFVTYFLTSDVPPPGDVLGMVATRANVLSEALDYGSANPSLETDLLTVGFGAMALASLVELNNDIGWTRAPGQTESDLTMSLMSHNLAEMGLSMAEFGGTGMQTLEPFYRRLPGNLGDVGRDSLIKRAMSSPAASRTAERMIDQANRGYETAENSVRSLCKVETKVENTYGRASEGHGNRRFDIESSVDDPVSQIWTEFAVFVLDEHRLDPPTRDPERPNNILLLEHRPEQNTTVLGLPFPPGTYRLYSAAGQITTVLNVPSRDPASGGFADELFMTVDRDNGRVLDLKGECDALSGDVADGNELSDHYFLWHADEELYEGVSGPSSHEDGVGAYRDAAGVEARYGSTRVAFFVNSTDEGGAYAGTVAELVVENGGGSHPNLSDALDDALGFFEEEPARADKASMLFIFTDGLEVAFDSKQERRIQATMARLDDLGVTTAIVSTRPAPSAPQEMSRRAVKALKEYSQLIEPADQVGYLYYLLGGEGTVWFRVEPDQPVEQSVAAIKRMAEPQILAHRSKVDGGLGAGNAGDPKEPALPYPRTSPTGSGGTSDPAPVSERPTASDGLDDVVQRAIEGEEVRDVEVGGHDFHIKPISVVLRPRKSLATGQISHIRPWIPDDQVYYRITIPAGGVEPEIEIKTKKGGLRPFIRWTKVLGDVEGLPQKIDEALDSDDWAPALNSILWAIATQIEPPIAP